MAPGESTIECLRVGGAYAYSDPHNKDQLDQRSHGTLLILLERSPIGGYGFAAALVAPLLVTGVVQSLIVLHVVGTTNTPAPQPESMMAPSTPAGCNNAGEFGGRL